MTMNSSFLSSRVANYNLSSSYPNITPLYPKDLNCNGSFSFNSYTKSWSSYQNIAMKTLEVSRNQDMTINSDLQPLNWLQKESIIDIDPLDMEDDIKDESNTPGYEDLVNPQISHAKVEVESQENSNIHDFVRFQAMRNSMNNSNRVALRNNNSFTDCSQNYSHQASGYVKPNLSYTQLIFMAIETCKDRAMTVNDIYQWCEVNYPYYKHIGPSWKNSLRHNLSINKSFRRMPRDGQQGGPGRGAYWVVDDKERKNLLDSIYRAHQTMPLSDRNGQRVDPPYSLIVNPPKNGPMLRIDGRITDASTYLQSKRNEEEIPNENHNTQLDSQSSEMTPVQQTDNSDAEYASMMYNLAANSSPEQGGASIKLSASYNSNYSMRLEDQQQQQQIQQPNQPDYGDGELTKPKMKNRRKSKHEKVRNYTDMMDPEVLRRQNGQQSGKPDNNHLSKTGHQGMTSVNVIVAPHFDHIYARYQQFLPPAISSDMEKGAFKKHVSTGDGDGDDADSNADAEFLKFGCRDDDDGDDDDDDDDDDENDGKEEEEEDGRDKVLGHGGGDAPVAVKLEKLDTSQDDGSLGRLANGVHGGQPDGGKHSSGRRLKMCWNGGVSGTGVTKLNATSVAFTRKRKVQRALTRCVRRHGMKSRAAAVKEALSKLGSSGTVAVKREMVETSHDDLVTKEELSDGYKTDSTMPMVARQPNRARTTRSSAATRKGRAGPIRLLPVKRKATSLTTKTAPPEKRYRSKRKRTRPMRIDESSEIAAVRFLASLEKRNQKLKNLDNLYNFNTYLKSSLSAGDSSCNSSVMLVLD